MLPKERSTSARPSHEAVWKGRKIRFCTDRIIVKFKPPVAEEGEATVAAAAATAQEVAASVPGAQLLRPVGATGRALFAVPPSEEIRSARRAARAGKRGAKAAAADKSSHALEGERILKLAAELSKRPDVEYAEPDVLDHAAAIVPNDTRYADQWGPPKIQAPDAWGLETGKSGVLIGIIDSGIAMSAGGALNHPDLDASRYVLGTDFVDGGTPRDLNGHGTHVAGIAAAESNNSAGVAGMNWVSQVYVCRTLDANGNGSSADFADAVEEIVDFAVANGLKVVINYSGGGAPNQTKLDACKYVNDHGMILCAAAGNDYGGAVIYPAAYSTMFDGVIAVGSTDDLDQVSDFSNHGPEVTVVAPGSAILSTTPPYAVNIPGLALNYDELDGTSMACPMVAGLASLMWSRHPSFSNKKIRDCLTGTAKKLGTGSFDNTWGHGRVDAYKALKCGDLQFSKFTNFTLFTKFTPFTQFTKFTPFTQFTPFTRFTPFTKFTPFTLFTKFTPFTKFPFTPFTKFTQFTKFDPGAVPGGWKAPSPFIRFGGAIFTPEELHIGRFEELAGAAESLQRAGISTLDVIATADPMALADALEWGPEDAGRLLEIAQDLMRRL